jgi:hypothetical protein
MKTPALNSEVPAADAAPLCRYLRNKRMFVPAQAATAIAPADENDESFYWCNKTLGALGADDDRVHPCLCRPGRVCHEV